VAATRRITILMTGAGGFVGPYLGAALNRRFGDRARIVATSRNALECPTLGMVVELDVTNRVDVDDLINHIKPNVVVHLAGIASVTSAVADPEQAWQIHLFGSLNVANAILKFVPESLLLWIGTGQAYGATARSGLSLTETAVLAPTNDYEVTKAAADLALGALGGKGLRCIRMRPFNHTGPGQSADFVVPGFAAQIARIEARLQSAAIKVGNLEAERDFLDVRDVAEAYAMAIENAECCDCKTPIFNIASGVPRSIKSILNDLLALSSQKIEVVQDSSRMRSSDTPRYVGDARLAQGILGWTPKIEFAQTMHDTLNDIRRRIR